MPRNTKQGKEKAKEKPDVLKKDYCFADDDRSSGREKGLNSKIYEGGFIWLIWVQAELQR